METINLEDCEVLVDILDNNDRKISIFYTKLLRKYKISQIKRKHEMFFFM